MNELRDEFIGKRIVVMPRRICWKVIRPEEEWIAVGYLKPGKYKFGTRLGPLRRSRSDKRFCSHAMERAVRVDRMNDGPHQRQEVNLLAFESESVITPNSRSSFDRHH